MQPFIIIFSLRLCISKASIHLRSSWYFTFLCNIFQVTVCLVDQVVHSCSVYTVCLSIFKCSLIRDPIVLQVSPTYTILQCAWAFDRINNIICQTLFRFECWFTRFAIFPTARYISRWGKYSWWRSAVHKMNFDIVGETRRAIVCSTNPTLRNEFLTDKVFTLFMNNGYPRKFLRAIRRHIWRNKLRMDDNRENIYFKLPYINEKLKRCDFSCSDT